MTDAEDARRIMVEDENVLFFGLAVPFLQFEDIKVLDIEEKVYASNSFGLRKNSEFKVT